MRGAAQLLLAAVLATVAPLVADGSSFTFNGQHSFVESPPFNEPPVHFFGDQRTVENNVGSSRPRQEITFSTMAEQDRQNERRDEPQGTQKGLPAQRPRVCDQQINPGPCQAAFKNYGFNRDSNRCELFLYGGCEGNENRFLTAADCQQTCGGGPPVRDYRCDRSQCNTLRQDYIAVKGCSPEYEGGSCCPTSYTCDIASVATGGDLCGLQTLSSGSNCAADCFCDTPRRRAKFVQFIQRGCVPVYLNESCCARNFVCPGNLLIAEDQSGANPPAGAAPAPVLLGVTPAAVSSRKCLFAGHEVTPGHNLSTTDPRLFCTCTTPPDLTCTQRTL